MPADPLDEILQEAEGLVSLLKDKQPGLQAYTTALHERLSTMHALTTRVLGR